MFFPHNQRLQSSGLDQVGGPLGNSVKGADQVTADLEGEDGSVDNADVGGSVDLEVGVDDTTLLLGQHGVGGDGVEVGAVLVDGPRLPGGLLGILGDGLEAGGDLGAGKLGEGSGAENVTDELGNGDLELDIVVQHEVVGVDVGVLGRVARGDVDGATREGQESPVLGTPDTRGDVDEDLSVWDLVLEDQVVLQLEELEQVASLGDVAVGDGDGVSVLGQLGLQVGGGSGLVVGPDVSSGGVSNELRTAVVVRSAEAARRLVLELVVDLVLKVLADGGEVNDGLDAVLRQDGGVTDTRELEEEGRDEGTSGEDNLLAGLDNRDGSVSGGDLDSVGSGLEATLSPGDLVGSGVQQDLEVGAVGVRVVVRPGSIPTDVELLVDSLGVGGESNHAATSRVLVPWDTESLVRLVHADGVGAVGIAVDETGVERAIVTVVLGVVGEVTIGNASSIWHREGLTLQVVWEECVPVPALVSKSLPHVDLGSLSAGSLGSSHGGRSIVGISLGCGLEGIVDLGSEGITVSVNIGDIGVVQDRITTLDDKHGDRRVLRQTVGNDKTASTTTNDNIVVDGGLSMALELARPSGRSRSKEGKRDNGLHRD
ncbi:hypothetical protein VP1G_10751 [Cytospora mali]|uniref:Uncharacterized protein n=1 Tax=Cytospora mali TaxID=578113 RepID=A0A194UUC9_CYTMA|nr:hypothetical protein VP1G_10751 [Valsa mali var. pyri (nom. inval.)]